MKTFLIIAVFSITLLKFGNASPRQEEYQDSSSKLIAQLAGSGEDKEQLANSKGSDEVGGEIIIASVDPEPFFLDSDKESRSSENEEDKENASDLGEDKLITQDRQKPVGHDYFRVDSEETAKQKFIIKSEEELSPETKQYMQEMEDGDKTVLFGTNQHLFQPDKYPDFSRRFVFQYPYTEIVNRPGEQGETNLKPKLAPPELVLQVAKESAILDAITPINPTDDIIRKDILRDGNYWNSFWKEEVDPKILRTKHKKLQSVQAKVLPGTDIYKLVAILKQVSPRLLYVINKGNRQYQRI